MGEIRKRADGKIIKTKNSAARQAAFRKQLGKKAKSEAKSDVRPGASVGVEKK